MMSMFEGMDKNAKIGLIAGAGIVLIIFIGLMFWLFSDKYEVIFKDMENRDASNVVSALESMKVPYQLENDGKDILVETNRAQEVKLKLISQGIASNTGKGFELFDNADLGMTEYSQKVNYLRALQGELARSIMAIDGIKYARVHLVLPETSLFRQKEQKSSASVSVVPESGVVLSQDQILGIQRLVSAATPGIKIQDVVIVNNNGITLSSGNSAASEDNVTTVMIQKKREAELYFENKVVSILDKTFGYGASVVTISVDLALDKVHRKEEVVLPNQSKDSGVIRKRELKSSNNNEAVIEGPSTIEVEYQLGRRIEEIVSMPGAIKKINVGVLVPENVGTQQLMNLRDIISRSVGLDVERGDDLSIYPMKIDVLSAMLNRKSGDDAQELSKGNESGEAKTSLLSSNIGYMVSGVFISFVIMSIFLFYSIKAGKLQFPPRTLTASEKEVVLNNLRELLSRE